MPYYGGDYYSGDYYSGDPGFLSSFLKWGKGLLGVGTSMLPGVGAVAGRIVSKIPAPVRKAATIMGPPVVSGIAGAAVETKLARMGAPSAVMPMPGVSPFGAPGALMPGGGMRGYHMSKARYAPPGRMHGGALIPPHPVRNRRMRVTNPRALRRALRRAHGFARLARKVMSFPIQRPPRGRALFKKRARKR